MSSKSFALITEGASEHYIIKHILLQYMDDEPDINQIQPQLLNGKQQTIGGWNEVLKYCEREEDLWAILKFNDYIVIQIDTDQCQISPYSVNKVEGGKVLTNEELWERVYDRIMDALPSSIDKTRIIIAICSDTIECWLLPVVCTKAANAAHTNQCVEKLNRELRRLDIHPITDKNSLQARISYSAVLAKMRKPKEIRSAATLHYGFEQFLKQLDSIQ